MKTKNLLKHIGAALLISLIFSCSPVKKAAVDCPDITQNRYYKAEHRRISKWNPVAYSNIGKPKKSGKRKTLSGRMNQQKEIEATLHLKETLREEITYPGKNEYIHALTASLGDNSGMDLVPIKSVYPAPLKKKGIVFTLRESNDIQPQGCDTLILFSGAKAFGRVEEIGINEVKYRRCDNLNGPVIAIRKSDISVIKYSNGTNDYFTSNDYIPSVNKPAVNDWEYSRKTEGLGLTGFITSLAGLFVAGIVLGIVSIVFGAISLGRIKREPGRYKGKGFAIAAILIGLVDIIGVLLILGSL